MILAEVETYKDLLRRLRKDAGNPTYKEMARRIDLSPTTVFGYFYEPRSIGSWQSVSRLLVFLGEDPDEHRLLWEDAKRALKSHPRALDQIPIDELLQLTQDNNRLLRMVLKTLQQMERNDHR